MDGAYTGMKTYSQFIAEIEQHRREDNVLQEITQLFEHKVYKTIPGTKDTYREETRIRSRCGIRTPTRGIQRTNCMP